MKSYSQFGEDLILVDFFNKLNLRNGFFLSTCSYFLKNNSTRLFIFEICIFLVGEERLELSRYCYHWILNPTRLPVPPFAHIPLK